jgi:hypothetical protein
MLWRITARITKFGQLGLWASHDSLKQNNISLEHLTVQINKGCSLSAAAVTRNNNGTKDYF